MGQLAAVTATGQQAGQPPIRGGGLQPPQAAHPLDGQRFGSLLLVPGELVDSPLGHASFDAGQGEA